MANSSPILPFELNLNREHCPVAVRPQLTPNEAFVEDILSLDAAEAVARIQAASVAQIAAVGTDLLAQAALYCNTAVITALGEHAGAPADGQPAWRCCFMLPAMQAVLAHWNVDVNEAYPERPKLHQAGGVQRQNGRHRFFAGTRRESACVRPIRRRRVLVHQR